MARREDDRRARARERARKQAEENKYSGGTSYLKLPEGFKFLEVEKKTFELDILPFEVSKDRTVPDTVKVDDSYEKGDLASHRAIFIHRNVGPDKKRVLCPRTVKKRCPICEERDALMDDWDANEKMIYALKPQHKDLFFVIDLDNEREGVKILEHSYANFRAVLEKELREQGKDEYYDYFQLDGGYTVRVRFAEETYDKSTYYEADRIDFIKRGDYPEKTLDDTFDFDDCLIVLPYEQLQKLFLGIEDDDTGAGESRSSRRAEPEKEKEPEREPRSSRRAEPEPEKEKEPERETRSSRRAEPEAEKEPERETRSSRRAEPEPEKEKEEPARTRRTRDDGDSCPNGGTFGEDCDKLDSCPDCPKETWERCADKQDELKANK